MTTKLSPELHEATLSYKIKGGKTLELHHHEDISWDKANKRKSYRYPEKTQISWARLIGKTGKPIDLRRSDLVGSNGPVFSLGITRRGDWLANACEQLGLETGKRSEINLSAAWGSKKIGVKGGATLYAIRLLAAGIRGEILGYAAEREGVVYHADTATEAVAGVIEKIRLQRTAAQAKRDQIITPESAGATWGFCQAGIQSFLDAVGLGDATAIRFGDLQEIVAAKLADGVDLSIFRSDLKKMGIAA